MVSTNGNPSVAWLIMQTCMPDAILGLDLIAYTVLQTMHKLSICYDRLTLCRLLPLLKD